MVLTMKPDHILVKEVPRYDLLFLNHMLDIFNLISNPSGFFKVELIGFFFHFLLQPLGQLSVLPLEEHPHLMDNFPVLVPVDLSAAWAEASVHLVINAGSEPIGKLGVKT